MLPTPGPRLNSAVSSAPAAAPHSAPSVRQKRSGTLRSILRRNRRRVLICTLLSIVTEVSDIALPVLIGFTIDYAILPGRLDRLAWMCLLIMLVRLVSSGAWAYMFYRMLEMRNAEQHNLRVSLTAAALHPQSRPIERPAGEVLSIATTDADRAPDVFDLLTWALPAAVAVLAAGVWLATVNIWLGIAVLVGISVELVGIRIITPILSQKYDAQRSSAADAASTATDLVHGLRVLQGLGVQSRARLAYRARSRTALQAALINARFSGLSNGMMVFISSLMIAAIVVIASALTMRGVLTVGVLVGVVAIVRSMSGMMHGLSGTPVWWASISTSAKRIDSLFADLGHSVDDDLSRSAMAASPATGNAAPISRGNGPRRPGVGSLAIEGVVTVSDGQIAAVVTDTARDAQSLLAALAGRSADYVARLGREVITPEVSAAHRRDLLVEPHTVDLFDGTLREQLATRAPERVGPDGALPPADADGGGDDWAHAALRAAGAEDLLDILPEQLDTRIRDRGANLSGGQRQRIALARAVASDAPALVLHDPTTAVDAVTEQNIGEALTAARRVPDRITLLFTKSPALLDHVDEVVFVTNGAVTARGVHRDLLQRADYAQVVQR